MPSNYNSVEVLEIAEQIERNGARFYRRAAEIIKDTEGRRLLIGLAEMEDEHESIFGRMKKEVMASRTVPETIDPDGEAALYIQSIGDANVFDVTADPAGRLTGNESMQDIVRMAIQSEKDSVMFYLGVRDVTPPALGRERVEAIIAEEKRHIVSLTRALRALVR